MLIIFINILNLYILYYLINFNKLFNNLNSYFLKLNNLQYFYLYIANKSVPIYKYISRYLLIIMNR